MPPLLRLWTSTVLLNDAYWGINIKCESIWIKSNIQLGLVALDLDRLDSWQWILGDFCESILMVHVKLLYNNTESSRSAPKMLMVVHMVSLTWMGSYGYQAIKSTVLGLDRRADAYENLCSFPCRRYALVEPNEHESHLRQWHESEDLKQESHLGAPTTLGRIEIVQESIIEMNYRIWSGILRVSVACWTTRTDGISDEFYWRCWWKWKNGIFCKSDELKSFILKL